MTEVTQILGAIDGGDSSSAAQLLPLVYNELRRLAASKLVHESPGDTLQATALVHEAYLRLVGLDNQRRYKSRRHFFACAAQAMRRLLVDRARQSQRTKHGGNYRRIDVDDLNLVDNDTSDEILAIDEALDQFAQVDSVAAELVKLRYFGGLTLTEAAEALNIPSRSADRLWSYARAWLRRAIGNY